MTQVTIDAETLAKLHGLTTPLDIRDEKGRLLGHFVPHSNKRLYDPKDIPEFDEEEMKRRVERWEGIPSAEVRRQLEELM